MLSSQRLPLKLNMIGKENSQSSGQQFQFQRQQRQQPQQNEHIRRFYFYE